MERPEYCGMWDRKKFISVGFDTSVPKALYKDNSYELDLYSGLQNTVTMCFTEPNKTQNERKLRAMKTEHRKHKGSTTECLKENQITEKHFFFFFFFLKACLQKWFKI